MLSCCAAVSSTAKGADGVDVLACWVCGYRAPLQATAGQYSVGSLAARALMKCMYSKLCGRQQAVYRTVTCCVLCRARRRILRQLGVAQICGCRVGCKPWNSLQPVTTSTISRVRAANVQSVTCSFGELIDDLTDSRRTSTLSTTAGPRVQPRRGSACKGPARLLVAP